MARVTIDFFTIDPSTSEFVMYLVEEGPWDQSLLEPRLRAIQDRVYAAVDVAVDGHLRHEHPESYQRSIRIQVDLHGAPPEDVARLVERLEDYIANSDEHQRDIQDSDHIGGLRITAHEVR